MLSSSRPPAPGARGPRSAPSRPVMASQASRPQAPIGGAPGTSRGGPQPRARPLTNPMPQRMGQRPPQRPGVVPMAQLEPFLRGEIQKLNAHDSSAQGDVGPKRRAQSQRARAGPPTLEADTETAEHDYENRPRSDQAFEPDSEITMVRRDCRKQTSLT